MNKRLGNPLISKINKNINRYYSALNGGLYRIPLSQSLLTQVESIFGTVTSYYGPFQDIHLLSNYLWSTNLTGEDQ